MTPAGEYVDGEARCFQGVLTWGCRRSRAGGPPEPRRSLVYWDLPSGWRSQSDVEGLPSGCLVLKMRKKRRPRHSGGSRKGWSPGRHLKAPEDAHAGGPTPGERLELLRLLPRLVLTPAPQPTSLRPCPSGSSSYQPVGVPSAARGRLAANPQVSLLPVSVLPYPLWASQVFTRRMWYPSQWMGLLG